MTRILRLCAVLGVLGIGLWATGRSERGSSPPVRTVELTKVSYFGDVSDYPDLKDDFMARFGEEFGVSLVVNAAPANTYPRRVEVMVASGELTGLVLLHTQGDLLKMKQEGTILPLDYYLRDNTVWKAMPEHFRASDRFDGQIWGIPSGQAEVQLDVRSFRRDWADRLGFAAPETADELYDMARAFTYEDPDRNGRNDTRGIVSAGTANLRDLFQAYDARLGGSGSDSIVWEPDENAWVDTMLKPQMLDALRALRRFYREGILDPETFTNTARTMREKMWSGKYGSTFAEIDWGLQSFLPDLRRRVPDGEVGFITALRGTRDRSINSVAARAPHWVLLKNTPDPTEAVSAFVDVFLGDERACLWGIYGIEGATFRIEGTAVVRLRDPETDRPYPLAGITGRHPGWAESSYLPVPEGPASEQEAASRTRALRAGFIVEGRASGLLYDASGPREVCLSPTYASICDDLRALFGRLVVRTVTGEMEPEAAVAEYRERLRGMGGQQMLEEANKKAGLRLPARYVY